MTRFVIFAYKVVYVFLRKSLAIIDSPFRRPVVGGDTFSPLSVPVLGPEHNKLSMSPSSTTVHGGQYGTKYVTFE